MKNKISPGKWIFAGIPAIFLIGSLFHFIYDWSGKKTIIKLIAPADESIFQHLKLLFVPVLLWWLIYYFIFKKSDSFSSKKWLEGALASLVSSMVFMPCAFYFYTGAFGISSLWADIFLFFLTACVGQITGLHFYKYSKGISFLSFLAFSIFIFILMIIFTFYPPALPFFISA